MSIESLAWNDMTNTASGVGNITRPSGNEMDVTMKYRLPGCGANVGADVESLNSLVVRVRQFFRPMQQIIARLKFLLCQLEVVINMAKGNNQ
jgi:hypothetical protein